MAPNTLPALVEYAATTFGDREALVEGEVRWTFTDLATEIRRAAHAAVERGIRPGDRVGIWAPNSRHWIVQALGLSMAGAQLVPLNTRYRGPEAADILRRSGAAALYTVKGFLGVDYPALLEGEDLPGLRQIVMIDDYSVSCSAAARPLPEVSPEDVSDIIFTSGTTGRPKGVLTCHGQNIRVCSEWAKNVNLEPGDRYLLINPFFHTFGYKAGIIVCLLSGTTMFPEPVFDMNRAIDVIISQRITVLAGPPTIFFSLLELPDRPDHAVRVGVTGAANVPVDLIRRMRDELKIPTVVTAYGQTEACGFISMCPPGTDAETVATTTGPAFPGTEIRIAENGEILVRGYNVMRGYLDDPQATAETIDADGWLHTGDVGVLDERGYLTITDRLKDMFLVGGFNAYPAEIEGVLVTHPAIVEAAVIGVPDERLGEVGAAFLTTRGPVDDAELTAWLRERLANFKVPRHFHIVDSLPRNPGGKVVKPELRAMEARMRS
ncbi:FadD3 family acyl-CoA ligase [Actinocorallia populi]|uniref:FadD3 family acyl-CoA ligase n=1 Tax=Actinocorallia populi TaxID=2079200 RepID=UPI000D0921A5|nr:FadD3 family acyl-CoA ligase [Actinocorallia populi]